MPLDAVKKVEVLEHAYGCDTRQELAGMATISVVGRDGVPLLAIDATADAAHDFARAIEAKVKSARRMDPVMAREYAQYLDESWIGLYKTLLDPPDTTITHQPDGAPLPVAVAVHQ